MKLRNAIFLLCMISGYLCALTAAQLPPPKFLYSSDFNANKVHGYLVNATTGALTPTGQGAVATHTQPTRVAADHGGYRLYVINQGSKNLDAYFIYRSSGSLHPVPGSPFAIGQTPYGVVVHPAGKYVYVAAAKNSVLAFAVQSNGSLKMVPGSPFPTSSGPDALAIDPQGKYLFVSTVSWLGSGPGNQIDAYSINAYTGALTPVAGSPYKEPASPYCANGAWDIAVHPSGNFLVIPNMCEGIVVYRISRTTGTLSLVKGSPFKFPYTNPYGIFESIAVDPLGKYLWFPMDSCYGGCSQGTDTWTLNTTTGVPTYVSSDWGNTGCGLLTRSDPSGHFLYSPGDNGRNGCAGQGYLWGMSANRSNGSTTGIKGSPWLSSNGLQSYQVGLAVTP